MGARPAPRCRPGWWLPQGTCRHRAELLRLINYLDGALLWPDQHGGRRDR